MRLIVDKQQFINNFRTVNDLDQLKEGLEKFDLLNFFLEKRSDRAIDFIIKKENKSLLNLTNLNDEQLGYLNSRILAQMLWQKNNFFSQHYIFIKDYNIISKKSKLVSNTFMRSLELIFNNKEENKQKYLDQFNFISGLNIEESDLIILGDLYKKTISSLFSRRPANYEFLLENSYSNIVIDYVSFFYQLNDNHKKNKNFEKIISLKNLSLI